MRIPIESSTSYRGRNSRPNLPALALFLVLSFSAGALGGLVFAAAFRRRLRIGTQALLKPDWLPPQNWFAAVWTVLYVLMAIAAWIIWRERYHRGRRCRDHRLLDSAAAERAVGARCSSA